MRLSLWQKTRYAAIFLVFAGFVAVVPVPAQDWLKPVTRFPLASTDLTIRQHAEAGKPFTVAGPCGAFLGEQDGSFEAWVFPVKLLSHFRIQAEVDNYPVPIDVNSHAAEIEVAPDHTTITYSHIAFTVREILFATRCENANDEGSGVMALFEIEAVRPVRFTFSFTPEVKRMWPAPNYGSPSPDWVGTNIGGYYLLHEDSPAIAAGIAMPGTHPGILAPYQEKPKTYPLQLVLDFDPKRDFGKYFPLLLAAGDNAQAASNEALSSRLAMLNTQAAQLYSQTAAYYGHFFDTRVTLDTPDHWLNEALRWGEVAIDQAQVRHGAEVGLVAGFYSSGDSNRPGFGWYFGRDTLFTLYAVNSYGDFALTRNALEFLIQRQRADGKMMHEYSQTADLVDWQSFPYEYAAADSTSLFIMAMEDYYTASGDIDFLRKHWDSVQKAWDFERTHDSDGDGIYDNSQGTGWVESWPSDSGPSVMPHQEIYLAALDQQASGAMARLCRIVGDTAASDAAQARADAIAKKIPAEYGGNMYAFSRNADGTLDKTATIFPAIAWWDGHFALPQSDAMFSRWASREFSTDWGTREESENEPLYNPISYHQGSVWPLFTGWTAIAEYRTGHLLSGYSHLMQNAYLTWAQDLGAVTELLSGAYFVPFGRSSSHQLWSSAMVVTPILRGLFGLSVNGGQKIITIDPHLPAEWEHASLHNVRVGGGLADITLDREGPNLRAHLSKAPPQTTFRSPDGRSAVTQQDGVAEIRIALAPVELAIPAGLPLPGAATGQLKVLSQKLDQHSLALQLEALGGSVFDLPVRKNGLQSAIHPEGGTIIRGPGISQISGVPQGLDVLHIVFPQAIGYQKLNVRLSW